MNSYPEFNDLQKKARRDSRDLPECRVALVGDSATQFLATALKGASLFRDFRLNLFEAEYNQVEQQLLDPTSDLHQFNPEVIILYQSSMAFAERHALLSRDEQKDLYRIRLDFISSICTLHSLENKKIICFNYPLIDDTVYGSYATKIPASLSSQLQLLNVGLSELASQFANLYLFDINALQSQIGRNNLFDAHVYTSTESLISLSALPRVAFGVIDILAALRGSFKKCLILDLDNTLWGGVVGDDGWENLQIGHALGIGRSFADIQMWVRKLRQRGIIICVVSKNDDAIARQPFEKNPDMILHLDDISVFLANWNTKVDNINTIQQILNISFDSMVFLDDNPFERDMVRSHISGITVPELPDDPALWLEYIYSLNLFETVSHSEEDAARTERYRTDALRFSSAQTFANEQEFLQSLGMKATVTGFTTFNIPRVAQLTQRSNQFNLRTIRYNESAIQQVADDPNVIDLAFTLRDKYGDNGLIAVVVMKPLDTQTLFVDTWLMSCRVLKRGMEAFTLNSMVSAARSKGYQHIVGEYIPTAKNAMVRDHYSRLGFMPIPDANTTQYILDVDKYVDLPCHIELTNTN